MPLAAAIALCATIPQLDLTAHALRTDSWIISTERGVSLLVGKQGASVSGLPVRKTDDDYDEEEDDGEGEEKALEQPPVGRHPQQGAATAEQREEEAASRKARLDQEAWEQQQALLKAKPPTERLRKGGMLLLSEMFVGPPVETRIARARISKTSHVLAAKVRMLFAEAVACFLLGII